MAINSENNTTGKNIILNKNVHITGSTTKLKYKTNTRRLLNEEKNDKERKIMMRW